MEISFDFSNNANYSLEQNYSKLLMKYTLLKQKLENIPIEIKVTHNVPLAKAPLTYGVEVEATINSPLGCDESGAPIRYQQLVTEDEYRDFSQDIIDDAVNKLFSAMQLYKKKVTIKEIGKDNN